MRGTHGLENVCFSILMHTRPNSASPQTVRSNRLSCTVLWWAQLNKVDGVYDDDAISYACLPADIPADNGYGYDTAAEAARAERDESGTVEMRACTAVSRVATALERREA